MKIEEEDNINVTAIGLGIGYIKHTDPKNSKLNLSLFASIFYSSYNSSFGKFSNLTGSLELLKVFSSNETVFFAPNVRGGFLYTSSEKASQGYPFYEIGLDFGIGIGKRFLLGAYFSKNNILVNSAFESSTSLAASLSVIF